MSPPRASRSRCAEADSRTSWAKAGFAESYRSKSAIRPIGTCFGSLPPKQSPSRKSPAKTRCVRERRKSRSPPPARPTASHGPPPTLSHTTEKTERNGTFMKNQGFQPPVDHPASGSRTACSPAPPPRAATPPDLGVLAAIEARILVPAFRRPIVTSDFDKSPSLGLWIGSRSDMFKACHPLAIVSRQRAPNYLGENCVGRWAKTYRQQYSLPKSKKISIIYQ